MEYNIMTYLEKYINDILSETNLEHPNTSVSFNGVDSPKIEPTKLDKKESTTTNMKRIQTVKGPKQNLDVKKYNKEVEKLREDINFPKWWK